MGFESLLGNERLRENLQNSIRRGHISHFYVICGPEGSGKHTLANLLASAILCRGQDSRPCGSCGPCRKVAENLHPDFITVTDPEHKNIPVRMVREIREDMFIRPNEADYKIYLFPQELGIEGQNALLKVLEEPPAYGVFMLLTDNPEKLLPTVRSRSTELALTALPETLLRKVLQREFPDADEQTITAAIARSGGFLGQAKTVLSGEALTVPQTESFAEAVSSRSALLLTQTLAPMEKWKRDQLLPVLQQWLELTQGALVYRTGCAALSPLSRKMGDSRSSADLLGLLTHLKKAIEYTQSNVSPAAVCGYLAWALRK